MATHPSLEYVLVGCVAAVVTFLLTPIARRAAIGWGAVAAPRDRDVHAVATPRMGGVALFIGFALAIFVASRLPTLTQAFNFGPEMPWVVVSAAVICGIGVLDDRFELDSLTKLAGQVLATGMMVTLGGVQLVSVPIPFGSGSFVLGDLGVPVTILLTVVTINALNFIDGLDGLAAGVTAIAAGAFFVYSFHLTQQHYQNAGAAPTLLAATLVGACVGFLPHNFWPARVFMGDSGSMLVGLVLSAAAVTATSTSDAQAFSTGSFGSFALLLPLIIPLSVLALPFVDLLLAVVRRVRKGRSPFAPDKRHLHHRLLEMGHSHRRAVLLLYFWSALIAFVGVGLSYARGRDLVLIVLAVALAVGILVSIGPSRWHRGSRAVAAPVSVPPGAGPGVAEPGGGAGAGSEVAAARTVEPPEGPDPLPNLATAPVISQVMADSPGWTSLLGMGAVVAAQLAVGAVLGLLLDAQLSTTPIFVLVGLALGIAGAVAFTVSQFRKYLRNDPPTTTDHSPQRSE